MRYSIFIVLGLAGCVTAGDVLPMEGGQYSITVDSRGPGMSTVHGQATQRATVFCTDQHKPLLVVRFEDKMGINAYATNLIFRCAEH